MTGSEGTQLQGPSPSLRAENAAFQFTAQSLQPCLSPLPEPLSPRLPKPPSPHFPNHHLLHFPNHHPKLQLPAPLAELIPESPPIATAVLPAKYHPWCKYE